ncbi:sodium/calcium exchanger 2-like [Dysidea avara]|uniref:sodium/calcium exchanger 2-like n=1 Tax=Dysidea avara TaxID=196820 RepID=UPI00332CD6C1
MTGVVLLFWLSCGNIVAVLGCFCVEGSYDLNNLQSACRDYRFARDVFTARVVSRDLGSSFRSRFNYTIEVVYVFKGKRLVGDRITDPGPDTRTSCGNPSRVLNINTTYLVGIGGPCSRHAEWSQYSSIPVKVIHAIDDGCSSCPYANVRFRKTIYRIGEGSGEVSIELTLSSSLSTDITVQIKSNDITATGGGVDYDSGTYNVTFSAGSTVATFTIPITNDNTTEQDETFKLTILEDSLPTCAFIFRFASSSKVTIVDDDDDEAATISFALSRYTVQENAGTLQLVLVLSKPLSTTFRVRIQSRDITATGNNVDYKSGPYKVVLHHGNTTAVLDIPIVDDRVPERKERFRLVIRKNSLPSSVMLGNNAKATVAIVDDD